MNKLIVFWDSIRSKPLLVAFEGGASGALMNYLQDELTAGKLDFSHTGWTKLLSYVLLGGITAVRLLMRPQPNPTVPAITPPSGEIKDVPAKLEPVDPASVMVAGNPNADYPTQPAGPASKASK
jgi:hypothetical protein